MRALARWLTESRLAWTVVVVTLALSALSLFGAMRVEHDDDLLAFLPEDNADVRAFHALSERFGGLDVALIGVEVGDVFEPAFFARLARATKALEDHVSVERALSLANVQDFSPSPEGGIVTDLLVREVPTDPLARAALRTRVMEKDLVVGQLVSADGKAALIYAFAGHGADPRVFADAVRTVVESELLGEKIHWGGAPFISTYIYETTQDDLRTLTPWAVAVVVLLVFLAFRDIFGAGLALLSTGMGIVMSLGLMGALGVKYNIVLSSMPVILFSVGSAYGIHVLARFYRLVQTQDRTEAIARTLEEVGPTVLAAGLTTAGGLLSFLAMDLEPMRTFGVFTAIGILCTLALSLTFIPAVIHLMGLGGRRAGPDRWSRLLRPWVEAVARHRMLTGAAVGAIAIVGLWFVGLVDTRMDQSAFFDDDSPPALADRFLSEHFGGALLVQVHLRGDFSDPEVLREVERFSDRVLLSPRVSGVQHVGQVLAQINEAMEGERRVPDDAAKVKLLYRLLAGQTALGMLVTTDHTEAVMHVKLSSSVLDEVELALAEIEAATPETFGAPFVRVSAETDAGRAAAQRFVAGRIRTLATARGLKLGQAELGRLQEVLSAPFVPDPSAVATRLSAFLASPECFVELEPLAQVEVAAAVAALGPPEDDDEGRLSSALGEVLGRSNAQAPGRVEDLIVALETPRVEAWRRARAAGRSLRVLEAIGGSALEVPDRARLVSGVAHVLPALGAPSWLVRDPAGEVSIGAVVTGLPVLNRGLSQSATRNQLLSLAVALLVVLMILAGLYRSIPRALIALAPTLLTLIVIYAGMGLLGVHLDIGTSMLASIVIGAGVDYAVHLVSAWEVEPGGDEAQVPARAVARTGAAIWTNAITVAAGFFLLTLGNARPLENVGLLTAAAMITAALATFTVVPLLIRKVPMARRLAGERRVVETSVAEDGLSEG